MNPSPPSLTPLCLAKDEDESWRPLAWVNALCAVTLFVGVGQHSLRSSGTETTSAFVPRPMPVELVISPAPSVPTSARVASAPTAATARPANPNPPAVVAVVEPVRQPLTTVTAVRPAVALAADPRPSSVVVATSAVSAAAASRFELVPGNRQTPQPKYPELARQRGQTGTVRIEFNVSPAGEVTQATVARSSGFPLLDAAALQTVQQRWFIPESAGQRHYVDIVFQLRRAGP